METLPRELHYEICHRCDGSTLHNLTKSCKLFYNLELENYWRHLCNRTCSGYRPLPNSNWQTSYIRDISLCQRLTLYNTITKKLTPLLVNDVQPLWIRKIRGDDTDITIVTSDGKIAELIFDRIGELVHPSQLIRYTNYDIISMQGDSQCEFLRLRDGIILYNLKHKIDRYTYKGHMPPIKKLIKGWLNSGTFIITIDEKLCYLNSEDKLQNINYFMTDKFNSYQYYIFSLNHSLHHPDIPQVGFSASQIFRVNQWYLFVHH